MCKVEHAYDTVISWLPLDENVKIDNARCNHPKRKACTLESAKPTTLYLSQEGNIVVSGDVNTVGKQFNNFAPVPGGMHFWECIERIAFWKSTSRS